MRVWMRLLVAVGLLTALVPAALRAWQDRQMGGVGIMVFEDINYGGRNASYVRDTPDLRSTGFEKRISSLQVAHGETWEVCEGRNYTDRCQVFSGNEPDLRRRGWNDVISSLRRVRGSGGSGSGRPSSGGLELYAGRDYSGQRKVLTGAVRDLKDIGFNDRAVSVRVPRGQSWELCVSADYRDCRVIDRNYPDLGELGISRLASSARPQGGWRGNAPGARRSEIVLYDRTGYAGRSITIDRSSSSLGSFANRAESVEVLGGRWELCDQTSFRGRCEVVTRGVYDLDTIGLRGRVLSVRPR